MKLLLVVVLGLLLSACGRGGSISGDWGGDGCIYSKISFKRGGKAYLTFFGMEGPAQYTVDGDLVTISTPDGKAATFTRRGNTLDGGLLGKCTRL